MKTIIDILTFTYYLKNEVTNLTGLSKYKRSPYRFNNNNHYFYVDANSANKYQRVDKKDYINITEPSSNNLLKTVWRTLIFHPIDLRKDIVYKIYLPESLSLNNQGIYFNSFPHKLFTCCFLVRYILSAK